MLPHQPKSWGFNSRSGQQATVGTRILTCTLYHVHLCVLSVCVHRLNKAFMKTAKMVSLSLVLKNTVEATLWTSVLWPGHALELYNSPPVASPVPCGVFSSIPGFQPLGASSISHTLSLVSHSCVSQKCLQTIGKCPLRIKLLSGEQHVVKELKECKTQLGLPIRIT